jgi:hypothetical protein
MPELTEEQVDRIVDAWRTGKAAEGWDNPAGPLFAAGDYAETEITMEAIMASTGCGGGGGGGGTGQCSACTASGNILCC